MSGAKHPFDHDKTVIKSGFDRSGEIAAEAKPPAPRPPRDATVLAPAAQPPPRASLDAVLAAVEGGQPVAAANPIVAAATSAIVLLGRLRTHRTEMRAAPLSEHFAQAVETFGNALGAAKIPEAEAQVAQYALCATIDDVVSHLPELDSQAWVRGGMLMRFFRVPSAAIGFYEELEKAIARPKESHRLLEFMLICLDLGFMGQYRQVPDGGPLRALRQQAFETLRGTLPRADTRLSVHGQGIPLNRKSTWLPLVTLTGFAALSLVGTFFLLRQTLGGDADRSIAALIALNPTAPLGIQRPVFQPYVAPQGPAAAEPGQLETLQTALGDALPADGSIALAENGQTIVVRISNVLLFPPGGADLLPEFEPVAARIAGVLEAQPGPIRVVAYTDSVKPKASSVFKSNHDLSVARAEAVAAALGRTLGDPSRLEAIGKGELEPIGDNATGEGRAMNRRVEILVPKEDPSK